MHAARVALRRRFQVADPSSGQAVLGVDVGVGTLATITVLSASGVEQLLYFGRDVRLVKRDLCMRCSKLQAHASTDARRARRVLCSLRGYERSLNKTRCYQEAHRIVALAKQHGAAIAMEDLKGLHNAMLRQAIQIVAWQQGIDVGFVNPRYTSQACSKCGARGVRKGAIFRCRCGFAANADRNASVNIAKLLWERTKRHVEERGCLVQFSQSGVAVNQPVPCHETWQDPARSQACQEEHKPPISMGGS